jgi:PPOX class probable F420-dependent enzyme
VTRRVGRGHNVEMSTTSVEPFRSLLASRNLGVVATIKPNGRPHLSNVSYIYDSGKDLIRISVTDGRAKVRNLRRDPRVSFHVATQAGWSYAVVEGIAELSPVASEPDDAVVEELIDIFRLIQGEHPDWDEYRAAMVADRRLVLRIPIEHVYGLPARSS